MLRNSRFYVLLVSVLFSLVVYALVAAFFPEGSIQAIRLSEIYSLASVFFLYLALIAGPLCYVLPQLPFKAQFLHTRRALGVSAFYFAFLHTAISLFGTIGGFGGLSFLSDTYVFNIYLGFIALIILFLLAITSVDFAIRKMTFRRWKVLHRLVYGAGLLIIIHALTLGAHFRNISEFIPQIFFSALSVLLFLEANRFDAFLQKKYVLLPRFGLTATVVVGGVISFYIISFLPLNGSINVDSQMNMGNIAQQTGNTTINMSQMPGMDGDKTKRYTTGFLHQDTIQPGVDATFSFPVYDAGNGKKVSYFKTLYAKPAHLVVVDDSLNYFTHIHPTPTADGFTITTQFPTSGEYHLYLSFQPFGGIEQQVAFTVQVGSATPQKSNAVVDTNLTKQFRAYQVTLDYPKPLLAKDLTVGLDKMTFTIKDKSGKPVTTLKPYLAGFGHLVMINKDTYDYLHVHPANFTPPKPDQNGGPDVVFLPLGLYGPIKPGIYRVFAQFNPDGKLFVADFTIKID